MWSIAMRYISAIALLFAWTTSAAASLQIVNGLQSTLIPDVNNFKNTLQNYYPSNSPLDIDHL